MELNYIDFFNNMININENYQLQDEQIIFLLLMSQKKINKIKIPGSSCITCFYKFNDNILLNGD